MDADFSIELGCEDPVLDFPWFDLGGKLTYYDLKRHPELLAQITEAQQFPELAEVLQSVNSALSMVETAKCDAWTTQKLSPEEEVFGASDKCVSYVDMVFSPVDHRKSLPVHERFARRFVELLRRTPETPSAVELFIRRCYYQGEVEPGEGFYVSVYVTGYGDDAGRARRNWGIALRVVAAAVLQLSAAGQE